MKQNQEIGLQNLKDSKERCYKSKNRKGCNAEGFAKHLLKQARARARARGCHFFGVPTLEYSKFRRARES